MKNLPIRSREKALSIAFMVLCLSAQVWSQGTGSWPQWGGPHRNFKVDSKGLAKTWPPQGPRRLWNRSLGEGYSAIVAEGAILYTMVREPARFYQIGKLDQEVVVAMDAGTGKTVWEYRYDAPLQPGMKMENGPGPHSTPLIEGNHIYTVGVLGALHCLDKTTGKVVWRRDFIKEFNVPIWYRGYSCSPLAYKSTIVLPVGGRGQAIMAFNQKDGSLAWKKQDMDYSPSSPILINVDGQDQLVIFMANEIAGLDPNNGELLWSYPHKTDWGLNISTPVWSEGNLLFCTSAYSGGSQMLRLARQGNKTLVKELWSTNRMRVHIGNAMRIGDYIYGSSGDFGPAFFAAVDVKTGKVAWQDRSFSKASFLYVDGKLVILDEDGNLALATISPTGLRVLSKVELLQRNAWTVPSLVGTRLYLRDRKAIMALGRGAESA